MIDVQTFLMRWFFLCNLIRDVAEIQTLPYHPTPPQQANHLQPNLVHPPPVDQEFPSGGQHILNGYPAQPNHDPHFPQQHPPHPHPPQAPCLNHEEEWRSHCLQGIMNYQPGIQRRLVMDAMRSELVQQLNQHLGYVDSALHQIREFGRRQDDSKQSVVDSNSHSQSTNTGSEMSDNSHLDADLQIAKDIGTGAEASPDQSKNGQDAALRLVSDNDGNVDGACPLQIATEDDIRINKLSRKQIRDCMPQLVSAVLKSPAPFNPNLLDPVQQLRQLIISRCQADPSWGIELCWLLEAEVGRAWKSLFEHRQQTGRRLIIVMPADKAAVLAKIGPKKQEAFDLLQDAERVTAYGYPADHDIWYEDGSRPPHWRGPTARLPSSISLLRCSHFGDTMQFIDRLTKISLDLRTVPAIHRLAFLQESLQEMNRRLRRRMVTRGEISLDVEDNLGPYDWPEMKDLTLDMLKHAVHFPLLPNQGSWPSGSMGQSAEESRGGVIQVLNIVVPEARVLASRERCPYLVRLEVAETGLEGCDARLYAAGAPKLGVTVEEALTTRAVSGATSHNGEQSHEHYDIPAELFSTQSETPTNSQAFTPINPVTKKGDSDTFPRGGWQAEADGTEFLHANPYEAVRHHEYEQLHQHMQDTQAVSNPPQGQLVERPTTSTGGALLDKVFGQPWKEVCDEVRRTSPYGHVKGWRLASFILKAGEDIRREALVMQMISKCRDWFEDEITERNRPFLRPYTIMCVGGDAGLLECLTDAKSVDEVKKTTDGFISLRDFFERAYGPPQHVRQMHQMQGPPPGHPGHPTWAGGLTFEEAQDNFLRSLVGYSLVCYILQIKDRHNANILLDREGHIMHIDFGFVLGDTPRMAKVPIFSERAPFKLSGEFWDVLGGWNLRQGGLGVRFCKMFEVAFACASNHSEELASLVEGIMLTLNDNPEQAKFHANRVRHRLRMRGPPGSPEQTSFILELVNDALTSWGTSTYDWLQKNMNGYE